LVNGNITQAQTGTTAIDNSFTSGSNPQAWRMIIPDNANTSGFGVGANNLGIYYNGLSDYHAKFVTGANNVFFPGRVWVGNSNQAATTSYQLQVTGSFAATSKSFRIPHPTKENHDLVYGSLEGPEHGVYVRGKSSGVVELPDYWGALVDENTITVQLTPIGNHMSWVEKIEDNKILIGGGEAFYFVQAMRKDIEKLEVEVELPVEEEE